MAPSNVLPSSIAGQCQEIKVSVYTSYEYPQHKSLTYYHLRKTTLRYPKAQKPSYLPYDVGQRGYGHMTPVLQQPRLPDYPHNRPRPSVAYMDHMYNARARTGFAKPKVHLRFFSFGTKASGRPDVLLPVLFEFDARNMRKPPENILYFFTGLDQEIRDEIWSHRTHEIAYQNALATIKDLVRELHPAGPREYAVLVYCASGVHRSVCFMSRLYRELKRWPRVTASATHLDLRRGVEKREGRWERAQREGYWA